jgi:hypothetical protein
MSAARGVTAEELVRALKRRKAALPAEIGTFVVLEACESMISRGACSVTLATVLISDEGTVRIEDARASDEAVASRTLHGVLTTLLVAAGPAPTPGLMRLVEEGPRGGEWTLRQMRDDLEASLVPLNRTASRRVLARLVRETTWNERPSSQKGPTFSELDAELSSLLGVEGPAPSVEEPAPAAAKSARERDATVREPVQRVDPMSDEIQYVDEPVEQSGATERFREHLSPVPATSGPRRTSSSVQKTILEGSPDDDFRAPPATESRNDVERFRGAEFESSPVLPAASFSAPGQLRDLDSLDGRSLPPKSGRGLAVGGALVVLAVALIALTLFLRPDALSKLSGDASAKEPLENKQPSIVHKPVVGGDLVVHVTPDRAQVLRFVGRGPATVPHLPVGVAHEFAAVLDGSRSTRAIIPPNGEWETTPDGPRFELAMQLGPLPAASSVGPTDLGETLLPRDVGHPGDTLGTARIVTTPRGAKVYQLIGFAPDVKVEDLPLDQTQELLVYAPGHQAVVRVVTPGDFVEKDGRKVADVNIALTPNNPKRR